MTRLLFFLFILFSPVQLGKHWWPDWSLVNGVRIDYLSPTFYVNDILLILLLIITLKRLRLPLLPISLLSVYCFLFIVFSRRPLLALYWSFRYAEIPLVGYLTFLFAKNIKSSLQIALSIGVLFSVGLGIVQVIMGKTTGVFWILGERSFDITTPGISTITVFGRTMLRPYAIFPHPNALAGWLAVVFFFISIISKKNKQRSITRTVALAGILLSASRAALFSIFIAFFSPSLFSLPLFHGSFITFSKNSLEDRIVLTKASWNMFLSHPLIGVGPGHFLVELPRYLPTNQWNIQPVHNVFLLLLCEFGLVGVGGLLWTSYWITRKFPQDREQVKQWLPVLVVFLGTGMVDHYWLTAQQNRILLGIVLGIYAFGVAGFGAIIRRRVRPSPSEKLVTSARPTSSR